MWLRRSGPLAWASLALLLGLGLTFTSLRAFDCWMQPDGPDCACFDNTGAWNPSSSIIQDTAIPTVGTRESCNPPIDNGGKPYYQMVVGCTSIECAAGVEYMFTFGGVYPAREEWCTETVAFWHRQTGIPYTGGYRNAWYHNWLVSSQGVIKDWYETEQALAGGRGRWLAAEDVTYTPFALGLTVPLPGAYVAIRNYDSTTNTWVNDTATTSSGKHSLMINEMWVHRRPSGRVVKVEVSLLEGNSGEQVKDVGHWDDILALTPQGSGTIGASKKIRGFGIDRSPTLGWEYDRARLHFVDVPTVAAATTVRPVPQDDGEEQGHEEFMARLLSYARVASANGGPAVISQQAPTLTRIPDGRKVKWVFPAGSQQEITILIDLLDVHPLPIASILMTWAPGFVPATTRVAFSRDGTIFTEADVPNLANAELPGGGPVLVPAAFTQTGDGVPVRFVRISFPKNVFQEKATLREIAFEYRHGTSDDAPQVRETRTVDVDIQPHKCPNEWNIKANNDLVVAVLGRPGFDVHAIVAESVKVAGASPVSWKYDDVGTPLLSDVATSGCGCGGAGPDGVPDLVLRFERAGINAALGSVKDNQVRVLKLTGKLGEHPSDRIKGSDCLTVRVPGKGM